jgi:hypothetical protein
MADVLQLSIRNALGMCIGRFCFAVWSFLYSDSKVFITGNDIFCNSILVTYNVLLKHASNGNALTVMKHGCVLLNYFHKVPVILHDNIQCLSQQPYGPPN